MIFIFKVIIFYYSFTKQYFFIIIINRSKYIRSYSKTLHSKTQYFSKEYWYLCTTLVPFMTVKKFKIKAGDIISDIINIFRNLSTFSNLNLKMWVTLWRSKVYILGVIDTRSKIYLKFSCEQHQLVIKNVSSYIHLFILLSVW